jgi:predicted secreted protein
MSAYLISKVTSNHIDTPVFADAESDDELIIMFTDRTRARDFIRQSNTLNHEVIALDNISFMEWLIQCHRSGIKSMVTDPTWPEMKSGMKVNSLNIEAHLKHAGAHVVMVASPEF